MPALDPETRERWREMVVVDRDAATVGTIASFYLDQASGLPTWALVRGGWLGDRHSFVPLAHAVEVDGEVRLPYTKAQVNDAPHIDPDSELSADDELALSGHYGLADHHGAVAEPPPEPTPEPQPRASRPTAGTPEPQPTPVVRPPNREGSPAAEAGAAAVHSPRRLDPVPDPAGEGGLVVTRSEEEMAVAMRTRVRRLRLRRYLVTEYVTRTIPVQREKVRLELVSSDEVVDGGADGWDVPEQGEATQLEVVLHREEPEFRLRPVPVERVRLVKQLVTERRTVSGWLRKEHVEVDEEPPRGGSGPAQEPSGPARRP
jgi:Domain of unknown function (DUF2382)/PRC-barrel domain